MPAGGRPEHATSCLIDSIKLESKRTIDLGQFVDAKDIDYRYFERPYFLVPGTRWPARATPSFATRSGRPGRSASGTISGREWLVAVAPLEDGLVMEMLRYADELRDPAEYFDEVPSAKPQKEMIDLASQPAAIVMPEPCPGGLYGLPPSRPL